MSKTLIINTKFTKLQLIPSQNSEFLKIQISTAKISWEWVSTKQLPKKEEDGHLLVHLSLPSETREAIYRF